MSLRVLAVNPRKSTTKIGFFSGREEIVCREIHHDEAELSKFQSMAEQWSHRLRALEELLSELKLSADDAPTDAVIALAALPVYAPGGAYSVDGDLLDMLKTIEPEEGRAGLGASLADSLAQPRKAPAFAVAEIASEDLDPISRISGLPELPFGCVSHTLSISDAVHRASYDLSIPDSELSVVVAHLGKGFSICSHRGGRVIDLSTSNERGPFSPVMTGSAPAAEIIRMAYSGLWSRDALLEQVKFLGGMMSYTGAYSLQEIAMRSMGGDSFAGLVMKSMAYQIAQEIASQSTALSGRVDGIILTGGCAMEELFVDMIKDGISWIKSRILVYPGEDELRSMANCALRVLMKEERVRVCQEAVARRPSRPDNKNAPY
ncbi:MAG: butyrate kinase [Synergistaceae bacterium]|nr:butyrate kinase [Synergistaceae bacterium]